MNGMPKSLLMIFHELSQFLDGHATAMPRLYTSIHILSIKMRAVRVVADFAYNPPTADRSQFYDGLSRDAPQYFQSDQYQKNEVL